jgi:hypothetical protein
MQGVRGMAEDDGGYRADTAVFALALVIGAVLVGGVAALL